MFSGVEYARARRRGEPRSIVVSSSSPPPRRRLQEHRLCRPVTNERGQSGHKPFLFSKPRATTPGEQVSVTDLANARSRASNARPPRRAPLQVATIKVEFHEAVFLEESTWEERGAGRGGQAPTASKEVNLQRGTDVARVGATESPGGREATIPRRASRGSFPRRASRTRL